jgi:hypothetical protein
MPSSIVAVGAAHKGGKASISNNKTVQIQDIGLTFSIHGSASANVGGKSSVVSSESELNDRLALAGSPGATLCEQSHIQYPPSPIQSRLNGCATMIDAQTQAQTAQVGGGRPNGLTDVS